ncbi:hypothetical protein NG895_19510 [Aeoliella sp. ICT_H6.2]|uniref:Uncharacterized protein n=1 Tax=Aeoliella straminimaris TaxID=2954799 RepID=A0A9X2JIV0_9BACT|nr:hypothetical protein [Aeoliella straminimaris]MCO6046093.1 hypothetical protein [Aeoliella straminimaris]
MNPLLLTLLPLAAMTERLWYALPLLVSVSLVYAATRHEEVPDILSHAWRFALWIVVFMGIGALVVQITTWTLR